MLDLVREEGNGVENPVEAEEDVKYHGEVIGPGALVGAAGT